MLYGYLTLLTFVIYISCTLMTWHLEYPLAVKSLCFIFLLSTTPKEYLEKHD